MTASLTAFSEATANMMATPGKTQRYQAERNMLLGSVDSLPEQGLDLKEHMAQIEIALIRAALERTGGVVAHAAQMLGLRRTTLAEKLRKYGLDHEGQTRDD